MKRGVRRRVDVAGLQFDPILQEDLLNDITDYLKYPRQASFCVAKPYVEFFIQAWRDPQILTILNNMDRVVADGVSVQWAASYLAGKRGIGYWLRSLIIDIQNKQWREQIIPERGAGVDATQKLLQRASRLGWTIAIVGGPKDTKYTKKALRKRYPKLKISGVWSGFYDSRDELQLIAEIRASQPDILFVALGFPKQEQFIARYKTARIAQVLIGEGGTFDFDTMGGPLKRSPIWMQRVGLEWLWRLLLEPRRWRRQLALPLFIWGIYKIGQQK